LTRLASSFWFIWGTISNQEDAGHSSVDAGGAGRDILQTQRTFEEGVGAEVLDGIKVVLAKAQQTKVGLENVAV